MSAYNGWTNYETWNLALWLGNDQGSYEYWREQARDAYRDANESEIPGFTRAENASLDLSHRLENEIEENSPAMECGFYADVLNAAISEVNWYEIAEKWIEEIAEEFDDEDEENDRVDGE